MLPQSAYRGIEREDPGLSRFLHFLRQSIFGEVYPNPYPLLRKGEEDKWIRKGMQLVLRDSFFSYFTKEPLKNSIEKKEQSIRSLRYSPGTPRRREYGPSSSEEKHRVRGCSFRQNKFILEVMAECSKSPCGESRYCAKKGECPPLARECRPTRKRSCSRP
ncbi:conserved hypothetical protein [Ricinus communis]|uniref:Uncharacterized protein n=1 Tax=Ricinus communis TaxID=3988 RepID=B9RRJ7_RICCO|nr:conserved hypothetical protein [Ricinus communis]